MSTPTSGHAPRLTAVLREGERNMGCTEIMSPWGDAVAEDAEGERQG